MPASGAPARRSTSSSWCRGARLPDRRMCCGPGRAGMWAGWRLAYRLERPRRRPTSPRGTPLSPFPQAGRLGTTGPTPPLTPAHSTGRHRSPPPPVFPPPRLVLRRMRLSRLRPRPTRPPLPASSRPALPGATLAKRGSILLEALRGRLGGPIAHPGAACGRAAASERPEGTGRGRDGDPRAFLLHFRSDAVARACGRVADAERAARESRASSGERDPEKCPPSRNGRFRCDAFVLWFFC
jgi:hypothetical protein